MPGAEEPALTHVKTGDDSVTLFSDLYGETYHSESGAIAESVNKFVYPCRLAEIAEKGSVSILDIGFGLGYNMTAAIYKVRELHPHCRIEILSLENNVLPLKILKALPIPEKYREAHAIVLRVAEERKVEEGNLNLYIAEGDARKLILETNCLFDAVFLDPFSPKKNPELWTVDFFKQLAARMKDHAILATYSSATPVRNGMKEAGLSIGPGPGDSMKKSGTLATKKGPVRPFSEMELQKLRTSPERHPYRDPDLAFSKSEIMEQRKNFMVPQGLEVK